MTENSKSTRAKKQQHVSTGLKKLKKNSKSYFNYYISNNRKFSKIQLNYICKQREYRLRKVEIFKHNFRKLKMQRVGER